MRNSLIWELLFPSKRLGILLSFFLGRIRSRKYCKG
jgi:hypothetical protein